MVLSDGDKAECKEIAREIVKEVLVEHIASCPHGKSIARAMFIGIGVTIGGGIAGGSVVTLITHIIGQ